MACASCSRSGPTTSTTGPSTLSELLDAGDSVVALIEHGGKIKGTNVPVHQPMGIVYSNFRQGQSGRRTSSRHGRKPSKPPGFGSRRCRRRTSSWSGRPLRPSPPTRISHSWQKTSRSTPIRPASPRQSRFAVATSSDAFSPRSTRAGRGAQLSEIREIFPVGDRVWPGPTGEAGAGQRYRPPLQPDRHIHRPRRTDHQDRVLLRPRAGPRSRRAVGVAGLGPARRRLPAAFLGQLLDPCVDLGCRLLQPLHL